MGTKVPGKLNPEEEQYFEELFATEPHDRQLFGQFLLRKGLISERDLFNALMIQREQNRLIGAVAREKGWLSASDVEKILAYQEKNSKKFGEVAVEQTLLSGEQVELLLLEIEENHVFFGEALVSLGALSEPDMLRNLETFHRLKLGNEAQA
jgi:hypothetical protein